MARPASFPSPNGTLPSARTPSRGGDARSWAERPGPGGTSGPREQGRGAASLDVFEGQHLVGIITERDLTAALADGADPGVTPVLDYMTPAPRSCGRQRPGRGGPPNAPARGPHLPVVQSGRLVGVLSMRHVLGAAEEAQAR
jgi:CBS domain-containing protein